MTTRAAVAIRAVCAVFFLIGAHSAPASASQLFVDPLFGVSVTSDIEYGTNVDGNSNSVSLTLDVYEPTGGGLPAQLPAIVLMHGGYYEHGSKTNGTIVAFANEFASRGYVAVSINYRLLGQLPPPPGAPLTSLPREPAWVPGQLATWGVTLQDYLDTIAAATEDQATAVDWLADNAATYNINPDWLAAGGYSAGAVSSLALAAGVVDGVSHAQLGAVFSLAGALFGWEAGAFDSSSPGVFLIHGEEDTVVPFTETPFLEAAMTSAGVPYETLYVAGADHTSPLLGEAFYANQETFFQFMAEQLALPVPEPSALSLAAIGLVGLAAFGWRRRGRAGCSAPI